MPDAALLLVSGANYFKIGPDLVGAWARILEATKGLPVRGVETRELMSQILDLLRRDADAVDVPVAKNRKVVAAELVSEDEADDVLERDRQRDRAARDGTTVSPFHNRADVRETY